MQLFVDDGSKRWQQLVEAVIEESALHFESARLSGHYASHGELHSFEPPTQPHQRQSAIPVLPLQVWCEGHGMWQKYIILMEA